MFDFLRPVRATFVGSLKGSTMSGAGVEPGRHEAAAGPREAWEGMEQTEEFKQLVRARWKFVIPATVFFLVYYFLLPVLNGVATGFMRTNVIGDVNVAYLFALSQFLMAWLLAFFYIRRANTVFDALASRVRELAGRRVQS